jgi:hypothetical protein
MAQDKGAIVVVFGGRGELEDVARLICFEYLVVAIERDAVCPFALQVPLAKEGAVGALPESHLKNVGTGEKIIIFAI